MARKKITSLKGWTVAKITYSAGYYTMTLTKGGKSSTVSIAADQIFDGEGNHFENSAA